VVLISSLTCLWDLAVWKWSSNFFRNFFVF